MVDVLVMSRPSPSGRRERGVRPNARLKKWLAMPQREARMVFRVVLRARRIRLMRLVERG